MNRSRLESWIMHISVHDLPHPWAKIHKTFIIEFYKIFYLQIEH